MRFVAFLFCFLFVIQSWAQAAKPAYEKRVPRRIARDPEKLAQRLTIGLTTDSQKVNAIYYWITHNIRYNFKKSGAYDFRRNTVQSVLKRRRAICYGYSDLFNSLCGYAGIASVGVSGFTKTRCQYDVADTFYQEEHIWNAAEIEGNWYLFDATWDAGHVAFIRPGVLGKIVSFVTFGKIRLYVYKPRFVAAPTLNYFMRSGSYFAYDHLSGQPCFQLVEAPISVDSFIQDSAFYFHHYPEDLRNGFQGNLEGLRQEFVGLDDRDQMIRRGEQAYAHYTKNHFAFGISNGLKGQKTMEDFQEDGDSAVEVRLAMRVMNFADTGILQFDSALLGMKLERKQQQNNNNIKRRVALKQDKEVLRLAKRNIHRLEHSKVVIKRMRKYQAHRRREDKKYSRNTVKNGFEKGKWAKRKHNEIKRTKADSAIEFYQDSAQNAYPVLEQMQEKLSLVWAAQGMALARMQQWNGDIATGMGSGTFGRIMACEDDLDYILRTIRDTMLIRAWKNDSTLSLEGALYIDSIRKWSKEVMVQFSRMHRLLRKEMTAFKRYKSAVLTDDGIVARYQNLLQEMYALARKESAFIAYWTPLLQRHSREFARVRRGLKKGIVKAALADIYYEKKFYNGRKRYIRKHYIGISRAAKTNRGICKLLKKRAFRHQKKYTK